MPENQITEDLLAIVPVTQKEDVIITKVMPEKDNQAGHVQGLPVQEMEQRMLELAQIVNN